MSGTANDNVSLYVNGQIFTGWLNVLVERHIDRMATRFSLDVTERWNGNGVLWPIQPFSACTLKIGSDVVMTGYVDRYASKISANTHLVQITGRSKTADLVDCTPDVPSGQYKGYNLSQIANTIGALFGVKVIAQTPTTQVFADATLQRGETAFTFLERLGRVSGVLLTDDVNGNLVLTTAGTTRANGTLVQGADLLSASVNLNVEKRFSTYIIKGQRAIGGALPGSLSGFGLPGEPNPVVAPVITNQRAVAIDTAVPRYRPYVRFAEAQLDQAGMQLRANWQRNFNFGRATELEAEVTGWRQGDGSLWAINQLITVTAPSLHVDQDLLIAGVTFRLDEHGTRTSFRLGPVEGFTPDPGEVKIHCKKGKATTTESAYNGFGIPSN